MFAWQALHALHASVASCIVRGSAFYFVHASLSHVSHGILPTESNVFLQEDSSKAGQCFNGEPQLGLITGYAASMEAAYPDQPTLAVMHAARAGCHDRHNQLQTSDHVIRDNLERMLRGVWKDHLVIIAVSARCSLNSRGRARLSCPSTVMTLAAPGSHRRRRARVTMAHATASSARRTLASRRSAGP